MTPPPDGTPWWAWALVAVVLAVIAVAPAILATRAARRVAAATHQTLESVQSGVEEVRSQVQNTHSTNLRDDLDEKIAVVLQKVAQLSESQQRTTDRIGDLHSEIRDAREDIATAGADIAGVRKDARLARRMHSRLARSVTTLERRVDEHLASDPPT